MTTSTGAGDDIVLEAAIWHARLDAPDMDWDAFAAWLDADPAHREAYDAVALLDADVEARRDAIAAALPANDTEHGLQSHASRRRWPIIGGLAAAALIGVIIAPQWEREAPQTMVAYRTGPTETRTINLEDGSHILLDRNSRLALADGRAPRVEMQAGAAYFDIRHDPARALVIRAGNYELRDIGTRFDVAMAPDRLVIAVSEGKLTVGPMAGKGAAVIAGQKIDIATATGKARVKLVDPAGVGAWRGGRLVYQDAPLALVAVDLSRYVGRQVTVDPTMADVRVSGVFAISDGAGLIQQIEALLPVEAVATDGAVRLVGRGARQRQSE